MKKRLMAIILIGAMALSLVACGEKKTDDLTGTWKSDGSGDSYQEATITDDTITINWVSDEGKTTSLYWVGTYTKPDAPTDEHSWTSKGDTEQMSTSLMASQDASKDFTYKDGKISYSASALGTTTTVELTKED